jgi:hypothetical protein
MNNTAEGTNVGGVPKSAEEDKTFLLTVRHGLEKRVQSTNTEISATGKDIPKRRTSTLMANGLATTQVEAITAIISIVRMNTAASMADLAADMCGV